MSDITDKIRKLLSLAMSANEHEARAALAKAQELMIIHGIDEIQKEHPQSEAVERTVYYGYRKVSFMVKLAYGILSPEYGCHAYAISDSILIIGTSESATECCEIAITYAIDAGKRCWKRYWDSLAGKGRRNRNNTRKSYEYGFVYGVLDSNRTHREVNGLPALVVPAIVDQFASTKYKVRTVDVQKKYSVKADSNHALRGFVDGKQHKLNKQIEKEAKNA